MIMNDYEGHLCKYKCRFTTDGPEIEWYWLTEDKQTFGYILQDWVGTHVNEYFKHIERYGTVVQAGGNCGMYPRLLSERFKTVYTFEPDPLNFFMLSLNCQKDNIVKIQGALGDRHAMVDIHKVNPINVGMHRTSVNQFARVPQFMIDDLALTECDFIQLDVELYEINALKGATETLRKFHPVLAIENCTPDIISFLSQFDYKVVGQSHMDTILK